MVAARLMALLWPGPDTPTQNYPHLTEEDMPGIRRCFSSTRIYLQQTHPHVLECNGIYLALQLLYSLLLIPIGSSLN